MSKYYERLFWVGLLGLMIVILTGILQYGMGPKAVRKINPTHVDQPEQMGALIFRRLRQEVRRQRIIALGDSPFIQKDIQMWRGFLKTAFADTWRPYVILRQSGIPPLGLPIKEKEVSFDLKDPSFQKVLKELSHRRVILLGAAQEITHTNPSSFVQHLQRQLKVSVFSISPHLFFLTESALNNAPLTCENRAPQNTAQNYLACAANDASRRYFRKRLNSKKYTLVLEQHGQTDFLAFVFEPHWSESEQIKNHSPKNTKSRKTQADQT